MKALVCCAAVGMLLSTLATLRRNAPAAPGPATVAAAVAQCEALGLAVVSTRPDGAVHDSFLADEQPAAAGPVTAYLLHDFAGPRWAGRVFVVAGWRPKVGMIAADPDHCAAWGELFVCGDAVTIDRLTGRRR